MGGGIFVNGEKVPADMPAMLALGAEFKPIGKLMVSASFNTYFDQNLDYISDSILIPSIKISWNLGLVLNMDFLIIRVKRRMGCNYHRC